MKRNPDSLEIDRRATFAIFSLLAAALSVLLVAVTLQTAPSNLDQQPLSLAGNRMHYILAATLILTWAVFSTPFVVGLSTLLRPKSKSLALTAAILSAVGISLLGFGNFTSIGALLSIIAAGSPPAPVAAAYQVTIWTSLGYYLTDPGLMTWGLGQFLFGWLAWKSHVLPNWLAIIGMIGGIAGLLTLAVYKTPMLALIQLACFAVWGLAVGILLFARRSAQATLGGSR
jgi:hypothetical protein